MPAQLVITLDDQGKLGLQGPINNKLLCYGLLELAKDAIVSHHAEQDKRVVQPSANDVAALLKAGN